MAANFLRLCLIFGANYKGTYTSKGNPYQYKGDNVIRGFDNNKFFQNGNNGGHWWWIPTLAAGYVLYDQWPVPEIPDSTNNNSEPIIVPYRP